MARVIENIDRILKRELDFLEERKLPWCWRLIVNLRMAKAVPYSTLKGKLGTAHLRQWLVSCTLVLAINREAKDADAVLSMDAHMTCRVIEPPLS